MESIKQANKNILTGTLIANENIFFPKRSESEKSFKIKLNHKGIKQSNNYLLVEQDNANNNGLIIATAIVNNNGGNAITRVTNLNNYDVTLKKDSVIGKVSNSAKLVKNDNNAAKVAGINLINTAMNDNDLQSQFELNHLD